MKITPVILSGGSGSRLWPVSRRFVPKQFIDFFGKESLFNKTILRTRKRELFSDPIIVCNNEHRFLAVDELKKINVTPKSIILEPVAKNTAPAIAIAALDVMAKKGKKEDIILIMPSDHIIKSEKKFVEAVKKAIPAVEDEYLVTFGIDPTSPETEYGYIKKSKKLKDEDGVFEVESFVEKPPLSEAKKFVASNSYLWNSGIFMVKASRYLELLQKLRGELFVNCCSSYNRASKDLEFIRVDIEEFDKCLNISIDHAIAEKANKVCVVPIDVGWSDVGSWQAISDISEKDADDNSIVGDVVTLDTENCYINAADKMVTTIGVKDLIIVSLKDSVLVANKNNAQDVKKLFSILMDQKREECDSHIKTMRPWGSFETLEVSDRFKVKSLRVNPGASLALQMHNHRAEHWVVVKGTAYVTCGTREFVLKEDESTYIPIGKKHRLENRGKIPLEIIEVQSGDYLEEDDVIRFSDIYGR